MIRSNIKTSGHEWDKNNLVTLTSSRGRMYDAVTCKNCGMKGRRYNFDMVEVSNAYRVDSVINCPNAEPIKRPSKIEVTKCRAQGNAFANLTPGSVHDVVAPAPGYSEDRRGFWVMGVGEPVKLLTEEFTIVEY